MIGSTGRRAGATVAAIALAGAGALASAPLASAEPAASPQACLDSIKNVRFNDTNGQFLLGGFTIQSLGVWQVGVKQAEAVRVYTSQKGGGVRFISRLGSNSLSASADHDAVACKGAVMTFGFSKGDGSGYRNAFAHNLGARYEPARKMADRRLPGGSLTAWLPITPKDTGEWKIRQVAVRQGAELVVRPIGDVSTTVRRASYLGANQRHWVRMDHQPLVAIEKTRARDADRTPRSYVIWKGELVGITGHLTTISTKGAMVGLKGQPIVLQARKGGAKGSWQTVLVEQKSTHANGYYLLQVKRAKVAGHELRLHYPSPYQSIAKSYQYLGKVR
ncbi:hypothetical protein OG394_14505 [Kribbella sp. NBC_01245]|uniref:hypothetical protein n=1 Tax=Kribbella sp. NBC_01245 TaxID=2903578 RepID=UPI002E2DEEE2|nr:hypothetical protein [Kribbella sp. NBC_01245]